MPSLLITTLSSLAPDSARQPVARVIRGVEQDDVPLETQARFGAGQPQERIFERIVCPGTSLSQLTHLAHLYTAYICEGYSADRLDRNTTTCAGREP